MDVSAVQIRRETDRGMTGVYRFRPGAAIALLVLVVVLMPVSTVLATLFDSDLPVLVYVVLCVVSVVLISLPALRVFRQLKQLDSTIGCSDEHSRHQHSGLLWIGGQGPSLARFDIATRRFASASTDGPRLWHLSDLERSAVVEPPPGLPQAVAVRVLLEGGEEAHLVPVRSWRLDPWRPDELVVLAGELQGPSRDGPDTRL